MPFVFLYLYHTTFCMACQGIVNLLKNIDSEIILLDRFDRREQKVLCSLTIEYDDVAYNILAGSMEIVLTLSRGYGKIKNKHAKRSDKASARCTDMMQFIRGGRSWQQCRKRKKNSSSRKKLDMIRCGIARSLSCSSSCPL